MPITGASSSVVPLRALFDHGFDLNIPVRSARSGGIPLKAQLLESAPSGLIEQAFIDAYFLNYHTSYPFVHEPTFRAQFNEPALRPHGTAWQILLNTILALGAWSIGDDSSDLDITFYQEARACLQQASVFETGNLTLVQALLLLSNYAQKRNKPNTGWNYLGLAVRMAMSLGLHKEFPGWKISLLQREIRRRLWWGVFIFDSGAAKTFGRPILLPEECVMDAKQVLNIHDDVCEMINMINRSAIIILISWTGPHPGNNHLAIRIAWTDTLLWSDCPGALPSPHKQCLPAPDLSPEHYPRRDTQSPEAHG